MCYGNAGKEGEEDERVANGTEEMAGVTKEEHTGKLKDVKQVLWGLWVEMMAAKDIKPTKS